MLDGFIIEELRRREEAERRRNRRPQIELPLPSRGPQRRDQPSRDDGEKPQRGVIVIDL